MGISNLLSVIPGDGALFIMILGILLCIVGSAMLLDAHGLINPNPTSSKRFFITIGIILVVATAACLIFGDGTCAHEDVTQTNQRFYFNPQDSIKIENSVFYWDGDTTLYTPGTKEGVWHKLDLKTGDTLYTIKNLK